MPATVAAWLGNFQVEGERPRGVLVDAELPQTLPEGLRGEPVGGQEAEEH